MNAGWKRLGLVLAVVGVVSASYFGGVADLVGGYVARDWVHKRLPDRFRRFDEGISTAPFRTVVVIRLTLFISPPSNWILGVSNIGFVPYLLGSVIGMLPGMVVMTWAGGTVLRWLVGQPGWVWVAATVSLLLLLLGPRLLRRSRG